MPAFNDNNQRWLGTALVAAGTAVLLLGYAQVRDESEISLQMPYVLTAGFFAFALTSLGLVVLRSGDDRRLMARLTEVEHTLDELRESNDYLTQMLEAALLPDEELSAVKELAVLRAVDRTLRAPAGAEA